MVNVRFKKAELFDLNLLIKVRIEVLRAANQLSDTVDMSIIEQESYNFYQNCLGKEEHASYLAFEGDNFIGCGSVCFYHIMPTYHNPSGKNAYIMNLYTRPDFRRRGIASAILDLLVQEAKKHKITQISLEATPMGRTLYEKYGFIPMQNEMILTAK